MRRIGCGHPALARRPPACRIREGLGQEDYVPEVPRPALRRSQEVAMSHAALVNVGLFYIVVIQPLLLVLFVRAVRRAPPGPADSARRLVPEPPAPEVSASQQAEPARLPARVPPA